MLDRPTVRAHRLNGMFSVGGGGLLASAAAVVLLAGGPAGARPSWEEEERCGHLSHWVEQASAALWDEATGADERNYPPDRLADYVRMTLEIDIPDMNERVFTAKQTMRLTPIGSELKSLRLNAEGLKIGGVSIDGRETHYSHDGSVLTVRFEPPLPAGREAALVTEYTCESPLDGLIWSPEEASAPGRAAQLHTQGQAETNRYWFPSHDFPNERLATELIVTVPEGYEVSSNGRLVNRSASGGRATFHWSQDKPHVNYLVTLIVGKFEIVDVAPAGSSVPMPVYVPPGLGERVARSYGRTPEMVRVFEERTGVKYPWDRYAQLLAWNFSAGGMENTSATTMHEWALRDERAILDGDDEGLIAHELGHMWFGDYLTCKSWEHIWLNEGFATYMEALWFEARDGRDAGYLADMHGNMRGSARRDRLRANDDKAGARAGMASRVYDSPDEVFGKAANPYPKGASVLHMLRSMLGDEVFFSGLRLYTGRHALGSVETSDFRQAMEEVSGRDLERFFEQWVVRPGTPEVTIKAAWDEGDSELTLTVEQMQRIDESVPAFAFRLPVWIETDGAWRKEWIDVSERRHERVVAMDAEPTMVVVDPELCVLSLNDVKAPTKWIIEQARRGPTIPSRIDAVGALSGKKGGETVEALAASLTDTTEHYRVRRAAASSLGDLRAREELLSALRAGVDDARVRDAVVDAVAACGGDEARAEMRRIAAMEEESYAVRASALRALGTLGDESDIPMLVEATGSPSHGDGVARAALAALAELDAEEGIDAAAPFLAAAYSSRTRGSAMDCIRRLSEHDPERAYDLISPLADSHVERVRGFAISTLGGINDERGTALLNNIAATHPVDGVKDSARRSADRLRGLIAGDDVEALQREFGELQRELEKLREQVEEMGEKK